MLRLIFAHLLTAFAISAEPLGGLIIESPQGFTIADPVVKLVAKTTSADVNIRTVQLQQSVDFDPTETITVFTGRTNSLTLDLDTTSFEEGYMTIAISTEANDSTNLTYVPIFALWNPRFTQKFLAPDKILDINASSVLYRAADGAELASFYGTPTKLISGTNFNTHSGYLTPTGALIIDSDQSLALELNGPNLFPHTNVTKAKVRGDFGILSSTLDHRPILRNFVADTNITIPTPFFSADLGSNGVVFLAGWDSSNDTNTVLYRFQDATLTQIDPETRHVQGRIETDGTNVLWFSAPFDLDTNNFQVYLLTPDERLHLSTNYFPLFHSWIYEPNGLAFVRNGWTVFPRLDSKKVHQVWWRTPDGNNVQATAFSTNTVAIFDMRADGGFLASVVASTAFKNHLFFVKPGSPPLDLGPRTHLTYRFVGNELVAYIENSVVSIDLGDRALVRLTHPSFDTSGTFTCYVTASEPSIFVFQHSTDLQSWSDISTNLTATTKPGKFQVTPPPGFIRTRQQND